MPGIERGCSVWVKCMYDVVHVRDCFSLSIVWFCLMSALPTSATTSAISGEAGDGHSGQQAAASPLQSEVPTSTSPKVAQAAPTSAADPGAGVSSVPLGPAAPVSPTRLLSASSSPGAMPPPPEVPGAAAATAGSCPPTQPTSCDLRAALDAFFPAARIPVA